MHVIASRFILVEGLVLELDCELLHRIYFAGLLTNQVECISENLDALPTACAVNNLFKDVYELVLYMFNQHRMCKTCSFSIA